MLTFTVEWTELDAVLTREFTDAAKAVYFAARLLGAAGVSNVSIIRFSD